MMVKIVAIDANNPEPRLLDKAAKLILKGRVIVCPTDTGYAFSANALNTKAVASVFNLKGRSFSNPVHIAISSIEEAEKYAYLNEAARYLARKYLPGALTMVLPRKGIIPPLLVGGRNTVGIRVPGNQVMLELARMTGLPLTATSANISGQPAPYAVPEIVRQLGEAIAGVALILDQGPLATSELSTIVDLTVSPPQLIRQGRISWLEIWGALQAFNDAQQKKSQ